MCGLNSLFKILGRPLTALAAGFILLVFLGACTSKTGQPQQGEQKAATGADLIQRGQRSYRTHCNACHSLDPRRDGATGPAVWGSSLELLEARILRAQYPPGYKPKRPSQVMAALPHLKDEIPALHAYLNSKID